MSVTKVRIRFAKHGDLRLLSHHDLMRCLERALRRAALPVALTQGFTPRPRMSIVQALALGIEGRREVLDLELAEPLATEAVRRRLAAVLPPGLDLLEAEQVPAGVSAQPVALRYHLEVPQTRRAAAAAALHGLLQANHWPIVRQREDKATALDLRSFVLEAALDDSGVLHFRLRVAPGGSARPDELLDALQLRDLLTSGGFLVRDDVELAAIPADPPGPATTSFVSQSVPDDHHHHHTRAEAEQPCPSP
jgi:radical SAM-linked protein